MRNEKAVTVLMCFQKFQQRRPYSLEHMLNALPLRRAKVEEILLEPFQFGGELKKMPTGYHPHVQFRECRQNLRFLTERLRKDGCRLHCPPQR